MRTLINRAAAVVVVLGLWAAPAAAEIYIRNQPLSKAIERNFVIYLGKAALSGYFSREELARCTFDPKRGRVEVDGVALTTPMLLEGEELVPVVALAEALGYQKKVNRQLGITDYNAAPSDKPKATVAAARNIGGADYRLAQQRMTMALRESPRLDTHPELARVEKIGRQISAVSDMPTLDWNFLIVHDASPNAFCCGVGWVAVSDSLLALKLSDNELAGVLAHEIAHGCRKDLEEAKFSREQMDRHENDALRLEQQRQDLLAQKKHLLAQAQRAVDMSKLASSSNEASAYMNRANDFIRQAKDLDRPLKKVDKALEAAVTGYRNKEVLLTSSVFAQKDEYDADIKGVYYATRAGFSPTGLMDALRKLAQARAERFGQAAFQGAFSHPPVGKRIETMGKVLKDWRDQR